PRRLGLRAAVALRGLFLEPGLASGPLAQPRLARERARRLLLAASRLDHGILAPVRSTGAASHPHRDPRPAHPRATGQRGGRMIPELGRYAATVLGAYSVTLMLLGGILVASLWRAARV